MYKHTTHTIRIVSWAAVLALCCAAARTNAQQISYGNYLPENLSASSPAFIFRGQDDGLPPPVVSADEFEAGCEVADCQAVSYAQKLDTKCGDCGKSPCCCPLPDCYCCPQTSGVYAEWLYLHTTGVDMVYAIPQVGLGAPGTAPAGAVGVADHTYESGVRAGIRRCVSDCAALHLSYTWFESKVNDQIAAPAGGVLNAVPLLPVPNAGHTSQQALATYNIRFQMADIDYRYRWNCGAIGHVDLVLGGRYGNLEQDFAALYPFAQPDGQVSLETEIDFDGGGLRIGLDGERYIHGCSNLKVYGKGFASVLSGSFKSSYVQRNQFGGITAAAQWEDDRFVSILEGELGLAYEHKCFRLSAGYQMAAWFNVVTTPVYVEAVKAFNYVNVDDTITFDGVVARVEFLW